MALLTSSNKKLLGRFMAAAAVDEVIDHGRDRWAAHVPAVPWMAWAPMARARVQKTDSLSCRNRGRFFTSILVNWRVHISMIAWFMIA